MHNTLLQYCFFGILLLFYLFYTLRYFKTLKSTVLFTRTVKRFHMIAIWVVPFIWILLLKAITKPTPGSYEVAEKHEPDSWSEQYSAPTDAG